MISRTVFFASAIARTTSEAPVVQSPTVYTWCSGSGMRPLRGVILSWRSAAGPVPGKYENPPVELHLTANRPVRWFVNELPLPEHAKKHVFATGSYTLHALAEDGSLASVQFTVKE